MNAYQFIIQVKDYASSKLQSVQRELGQTRRSTNRLKQAFVGVFAVGSIMAFTGKVVQARAEFEKYEAVLINTFQSAEVGASALSMLTKFASETPFQLNEMTGSFVKLVNRGINPTKDELTKLGDLAASQGKGFDQLTEAILDAQTGEFERLKDFGIQASKSGDKVAFSFKGVTKEVAFNEQAIKDALLAYGGMEGVAGSMEAISKTLGGRVSNLKDKWNEFLVAVGGQTGGMFGFVIEKASIGLVWLTAQLPKIATYFQQIGIAMQPVIDAWDRFSFVLSVVIGQYNLFSNLIIGSLFIFEAVGIGLSTLIDLLAPISPIVAGIATVWAVWNAIMWANPITIIIASIVALIGVIGLVVKYTKGWGESWKGVVNGGKLLFKAFTEGIKTYWLTYINVFMIGLNKIQEGFVKFKKFIGIGNDNDEFLTKISADTERRKQAIAESAKKTLEYTKQAGKEFSKVGITVDKAGIVSDIVGMKTKLMNLGGKSKGGNAYEEYIKNASGGLTTNKGNNNNGSKAANSASDGIVSGGKKTTHITLNINKLVEQITLSVANVTEGADDIREIVQEELLRAVNSVNQMQTS